MSARNAAKDRGRKTATPARRKQPKSAGARVVVPVVEEQARIARRTVETGRVRIRTSVEERQEQVDVPILHEEVEVVRVAVDQPVDRPMATRQEGDVTIIPVHEERLVTVKQLFLVEEVHVCRRRRTEHTTRQVTLRRERVEVRREAARAGSRGATPNSAEGDPVEDAAGE